MKRKTKSIFAVVFAILLLLLVAVTLITNIMFSRSDTPKIFGHYIYMMETDTMEAPVATGVTTADDEANAAASIHQYTAVIAKAYDESDPVAKEDSISPNNAVLCRLAPTDLSTDIDSDGLAVRRISYIDKEDPTGVTKYVLATMSSSSTEEELALTKITLDDILGQCIYQSGELYTFIHFATGVGGILLMLVLPSVILVIMLIAAIVRANNKRDEEFAFEENYDEVYSEDSYDDDADYEDDLGRTSLYRTGNSKSQALERRRSSIAQNFERKAVNPNSPYQKARTMQFKAQHDVPIYTDPEDQIPLGGGSSYSSPIYTDDNYEGAHTGTVSNTGRFGTRRTSGDDAAVSHVDTDNHSAATSTSDSSRYRGSHEAGSPEEARNLGSSRFGSGSASRPATTRTSTPSRASKNKYETASVDELLAMIEDEKKKLDP